MNERDRDMREILNVGHGNAVVANRIIAIVSPRSAPIKRLRKEAKQMGKIIDVTEGRQTRSVLILDTGHVVLSALMPATLVARLLGKRRKPKAVQSTEAA